jgi:tripartite-type tricarboxylate transporter receptor subunit TctC
MRRREFLTTAAAGFAAVVAPSALRAQSGPIKIIYPFAAGGSGDALVRILAERIGAAFNETTIVENKTGGDGRIGLRTVKMSPPDGRTLLFTPFGPIVTQPSVYANLQYDTFRDFAPVSQVVTFDFAIATGPQTGAKSVAEIIAWFKSNPGKASYGVPGAGTVPHFLGAGFGAATGVDMRVIAYKGTAPAMAEVIGGQIPCVFAPLADLLEQHKAGAIRILAVSGPKRSPFASDIPTLRESGVALEGQGWYGVYAPAGTPEPVIAKVNAAIREAVLTDAGKSRMAQMGFGVAGSTPAELASIQQRDFEFWAPAIKASGFKAED